MYITVDDIKNEISLYRPINDSNISRFGPYMNKILGISNGNYIDMLLSKKT